ncbi:MAG: sigma 54-interacting transcriptional regulator [Labilithrix sp.]|nr:sigma 54-interacting transcriptional regulator [Labilithrix sp.]
MSSRAPDGKPPLSELVTELDPEQGAASPAGSLRGAYVVCKLDDRVDVLPLVEGQDVIVGRAEDATVRVDSPRASRHHARLRLEDGAVVVTDLGSRNGTRVNAAVLRGESRRVESGSIVGMGPLELIVAHTERALDYEAPLPEDDDEPLPSEDSIVVADPAMTKLYQVLRRLAPTPSTVLVVGETGAGKEIVAERVHRMSPRASGPFVRLNCASMPEALLEGELFGHERGAFTGADRRRAGYFEAANRGTLFLDEIGEMPLSLQAKLLRVLENRTVTRLGGTQEMTIDVRFVCATNRDLPAEIAAGRFRQDLYYRISTFTLEVPPLRERKAELLLLADLFARRFAHETGAPAPKLERDAVALVQAHAWPGNVRELRNAIEHAVVMANGPRLRAEHFPSATRRGTAAPDPSQQQTIRDVVEEAERSTIVAAIAAEGGNHARAAKRLGMSRRALLYKIAKYKLRG